jgi:hypothetical protein
MLALLLQPSLLYALVAWHEFMGAWMDLCMVQLSAFALPLLCDACAPRMLVRCMISL